MGKRIKCNNVSYIRTIRGVYIGKIENGQKNGWGLQINNNGNKYEGLFKNDEKYLFGLELICCLCGHTYRNKVPNGIYEKGKIHYKDVNNISAYNNDDQKDNINHEKVYHDNIYDHNIYHNNKLNFQYSSENEFAKGNICVHENRYIYIGTYKKGKKHGKGILINYNNYFMYSCIFYKNKIIYVDMLFSNDQKYMNMKNIDMKHYNTHNKKKIYLFLQKEYKNKILGFINFYKHITHKIKKKQENVHDKITFLKCLKELFFVTHTKKENNQMEGIIHTYKKYTINRNNNTYNIFKEKLHNITQGGNKTQHENVILYNKRKEKNKSTNITSDEKKINKHTNITSDEKKINKHTTITCDEKKKNKHTNITSDEKKKNKHTAIINDEKTNKHTAIINDEKTNKHTTISCDEKKNGYLFLSNEIKTKYSMIENMKKKKESYTMINNNKKKEHLYNLKSMIYQEVQFFHNNSICDHENKKKNRNIEMPFFLKRTNKNNDIEQLVLVKNEYNKCYNIESGKHDIIYNSQKDKIKKDKLKVPFFFKEKGIYNFFNKTVENKEDERIFVHEQNDEKISTDKVTNDVRTYDVRTYDIRTNDIRTNDIRTNDIRTYDIRTNDIRTYDIRTNDIRTYDIRTYDIRTNDIPYNIIPNKRETIVDDINSCSNNFTTRSNTDNANSYQMNMYSDSNNFYGNKKKKIKKRNNSKCEYSSIIKNKNQLYNYQLHNYTCVCIKCKTKCSSFKINKLEKKKKESYKCKRNKKLKQHDKNLLFNNYIFNDNFLDNVFVLKPPMDEKEKKKNYDKLKRDTFPLFLRKTKKKKKKKLFQAQNYIYWNIFELNLFFFLVGIPKEILEIFIYHRLDGYCLKYIDKKILKDMKIKNRMMRKYIYLCIQYLLRLREKYKYKKKSNSKLNEKINEDFILKKEQLHILNLIGRGGYSNVYRCIYGNKNILRINKFFDIHYSINNTALKIFLNKKKNILEYFTELFIVSNLRHPNVTLFLGAINNPRAIVLEYIQYGTLFDILHKYKINMKLQDIIKISKDITAFMAFLHNKGIMHCDLKSSNILISITRDIKICDFGLSVFNKYNKPKYLGIVGTYQWTAPEVLRSEGYTKEADIYSFGVILWEMIHRKIPFSDMKNPLDIIAHVGYAKKKLSVTNKNIPEQLRYILHSCLHKNTHKRKSFLFWSEYFDLLYNVTDIPKEYYTSFFFD
ncbi:tyrosine kinase-like protein, putative [Plasmodium reichenowi]|uniref:Tyrosine kinase-like protein, putative n=1 Tax=Plasmodium reichenowi TaxID=5854 RepID=A0A151LV39_PLARE|nr:tyrosine kinase-like protein, putative [Plasmodium reichenowi]KYO03038.1 tyrosine kinase-like protein, putative [Plasmodium reichenowi]